MKIKARILKSSFWKFSNAYICMKGLQLRSCHLDFGDVIYYQSENYLFSNKTDPVQ